MFNDPGRHTLLVGSVKSNPGHGEAASGILSVVKTVLALEHARISATLGVREIGRAHIMFGGQASILLGIVVPMYMLFSKALPVMSLSIIIKMLEMILVVPLRVRDPIFYHPPKIKLLNARATDPANHPHVVDMDIADSPIR